MSGDPFNPCRKDCPQRSATCHAGCERYHTWRANRDQYLADKRREQQGLALLIEQQERRHRRWTQRTKSLDE